MPRLLLLFALVPTLVSAADSLYEKLQDSCVEILVDGRLSGAGTVIDSSGKVITVAHMVPRPGNAVEVVSKRLGRRLTRIVAIDEGHDLMLLEILGLKDPHPVLPLAKKSPGAGTPLQVFGAPLFRHEVMLEGKMARNVTTYEFLNKHYVECLHVSGMAPGGMSGGPWVTRSGKLVGVQSGAMSLGNAQMGVCFVAPVEAVHALIKSGTHANTVTLGTGIEELWGQESKFITEFDGKAGLVLRQVQRDGPMDQAGIKEWQVITEYEGKPTLRTEDFLKDLRTRKPGDPVRLKITDRNGKNAKDYTIRLGVLEQPWLAKVTGEEPEPEPEPEPAPKPEPAPAEK